MDLDMMIMISLGFVAGIAVTLLIEILYEEREMVEEIPPSLPRPRRHAYDRLKDNWR